MDAQCSDGGSGSLLVEEGEKSCKRSHGHRTTEPVRADVQEPEGGTDTEDGAKDKGEKTQGSLQCFKISFPARGRSKIDRQKIIA